jgi:vitamin B12 transporter
MNALLVPRVLALTLGGAILVAVPLPAQQPRDTIRLSEIVITATRLPTPREAVPNAVTIITGESLRERGIATVLEALREVPAAAVVQSGSFGGQTSLFLRGGESDYVRVLVDGVPVNEPGGTLDLAHLTTTNVDRIEVVRGPASVLYGSDAVTGVVQVFTRRGTGAPHVEARARAGTYGSAESAVEVAEGGERFNFAVGLSRFASDGLYPLNNRYDNTTASGLIRLAPGKRTDVQLAVRHVESEFHFPTDAAGAFADSNQYNATRGTTVGLEVGRYLAANVEARLVLASHATEGRFLNALDSPGDVDAGRGLANVSRRSAEARLNLHGSAGSAITAGATAEVERARSTSAYESSFGPYGARTDARRGTIAGYVQAVTQVAGLHANGGVRVEDNDRFGRFATWRAGAVYRVRGGARLRAAAGTGFKEPTFAENFGSGFGDVGNPDLRPERSLSWEIGVDQPYWGGRGGISASLFDQRFRRMIQFSFASANPGVDPNYANVAGARASGVELETRLTPHPRLTATALYTYLHTVAKDSTFEVLGFAKGERLLRRPTHAAHVGVTYRVPARGALTLGVLYTGDREDIDFAAFPYARVTIRAYTRVDCSGDVQLRRAAGSRPGFAVTVRIENLFDRAYQEVLGFPARGRTVLVGGRLSVGLGR